jgi:DNA-binding LacI/PurR family transcriptional regulator
MSVIGMDNIEVAKYMEHSLTSIDTSPDEVCALAWDLLQKKMKNCYYRLNQKIVLSGKLVIRDSTGAAQK